MSPQTFPTKSLWTVAIWIVCGPAFAARPVLFDMGFEQNDVTTSPPSHLQQSLIPFGTETGTLQDEIGTFPPDLAAVVEAWPSLPEETRTDILAMVRAAAGGIAGQDR